MKNVSLLFLNSAVILFFVLFIFPTSSFAFFYFDVPVSESYIPAADSFCVTPSVCVNSQNPDNCGFPACPGGNAWTKYDLNCYYDTVNFDYDSFYFPVTELGGIIGSIGDKCVSGETGLRSGQCDYTQYSASVYKYCCTASGYPEACIPAGIQDTTYPPEGECPGGYIVDGSRVRSSACVPIITDTPTPPPTSNCSSWGNDPCTVGQVGTSVCSGTGGTKTCWDVGSSNYCWVTTVATCPAGCSGGVCISGCPEGATQTVCTTACTP